MRVLIVNAHSRASANQKAFQELLACVQEVLKIHNGLLEIKDEYIIRSKDELDDFLYDENTSFSIPSAGKHFDSLDFVIVSGDLHVLPWKASNLKVLTLLRMCLKVKKCLFAIGFAMQALVYLSASNMSDPINVINGDGRGGKLGDIEHLQIQPDKLKSTDYFLDSVTGDLYHFQQESCEWAPKCNVGLHHSRTAQEYNTIGKFVIKTPIYRPKKSIHNKRNTNYMDENVETKCYIKKVYLKHWLFQNCDMEFIVPYRGQWEVHSFSFTNKDKAFEVLAESEHGSLVIEYPRIIGVKFTISKRYKETYQVFLNYVTKYADEIICRGKTQNMSVLVNVNSITAHFNHIKFHHTKSSDSRFSPANTRASLITQKGFQGLRFKGTNDINLTSPNDTIEIEPKQFTHSGMASKMKGKLIQEHNYISSGKVRYDLSSIIQPKERLLSKETSPAKYSLAAKNFYTEDDLSFLAMQRESSTVKNKDKNFLKTALNTSGRFNKRANIKQVSIFGVPQGAIKANNMLDEESPMTKEDVRKWLYPDLSEISHPFEKRIWVPGNLTQTKSESFSQSKVVRVNTCSPDYRKKGRIQMLSPKDGDSQHASLRAAEPYVTTHDVIKEYQKRQDEKIIGTRKFVLSKGHSSIQNFSVTPSSRFLTSSLSRREELF